MHEFDPIADHNSGCFPTIVFRETAVSSTRISLTARGASQHIIDTDMWGVSDPAESARGRGRGAEAGSLTPHIRTDALRGALTGRHKTPAQLPVACAVKNRLVNDLASVGVERTTSLVAKEERWGFDRKGANRALGHCPPPRPLPMDGRGRRPGLVAGCCLSQLTKGSSCSLQKAS
jgi:hypothetical protein